MNATTNKLDKTALRTAPLLNKERLAEDLGRTLVLAPHPDDEALGCGGLIALLRARRVPVTVVFSTQGSASHPHSKTHPPAQLAAVRTTEGINACLALGVDRQAFHFLGLKDGTLSQLQPHALTEAATTLADLLKQQHIQTLVLPWRRDPHPDHVVTYTLGEQALQQLEQPLVKLEYPIWLWKNGQPKQYPTEGEITPFRLDVRATLAAKWKAVECHQSQLGGLIHDSPYGFVLTEEILEDFKGNYEFFFAERQSHQRYAASSVF